MTLSLSSAIVFVNTVLRFRYAPVHNQFWMFSIVAIALTIAPAYHPVPVSPGAAPPEIPAIWDYFVHWIYYALLASVTMLIVMTFIVPRTAGSVIRGALAAGFEGLASTVELGVEVLTGEVDAATGRLAARSGTVDPERVGMDAGLWLSGLDRLYTAAQACSAAINTVWRYEHAATREVEVYRRQKVLRSASFNVLTLILRSMLSSFMMVVYPLQTGGLDCRAERAARQPLRALAGAVGDSLRALARVLRDRARFRDVLPLLAIVEARFLDADAALQRSNKEGGAADPGEEPQSEVGAAQGAQAGGAQPTSLPTQSTAPPPPPASLRNQVMSSHMLASTLHTLCLRLCQLHLGLAEGLGRDDLGAPMELAAYLAREGVRAPHLWPQGAVLPGEVLSVEKKAASSSTAKRDKSEDTCVEGRGLSRSSVRRASVATLRDSLLAATALEAATTPGEAGALALDRASLASKGEALKGFLAAQQPRLQVAPVHARPLSPGQRLLEALYRRTGVHRNHLRVGVQGVVGYFVIMLMVIIPAANDAFDHRMLWGLIIVITVLEPMTGQVMIKGVQRLLGTALGAGLGVGVMYFTYLCNGLTYSSAHVQKVCIQDECCWGFILGGEGDHFV